MKKLEKVIDTVAAALFVFGIWIVVTSVLGAFLSETFGIIGDWIGRIFCIVSFHGAWNCFGALKAICWMVRKNEHGSSN